MRRHEPENGPRFTLANGLTAVRVLAAPLILYLAWIGEGKLLIGLMTVTFLTDAADGAAARLTGNVTRFGARFDSIADAIAYTAMGIAVLVLWPEVVHREWLAFVAVFGSLALSASVAIVKFGKLTAYHTHLVKVAVASVAVGLLLLLLDWAYWPFRAAAILAVLAGLEEIAITLLLREPSSDVASIHFAWRERRPK
jgi:cardiolipin synthase